MLCSLWSLQHGSSVKKRIKTTSSFIKCFIKACEAAWTQFSPQSLKRETESQGDIYRDAMTTVLLFKILCIVKKKSLVKHV